MFSVYKRELKSLFTCYRGYTFAAVFMIAFCLLRMFYHYVNMTEVQLPLETLLGFATSEYSLAFLPVVFALTAPLLTFGIFASEREKNATSFLRTLPLSVKDIVFGKYLAVLTAVAVPYAFLALLSWMLGFYDNGNALTVIINILAYFLVCVTVLSIYFFVSSLCKNKLLALGIELGIGILLTVLIATRYFVPRILTKIFEFLSIIASHESSIYGILDISALVMWVTLSVLFVCLAYLFVKKEMRPDAESAKKVFGATTKKGLTVTVSLLSAIVLLLNVGANFIPAKINYVDASGKGIYTLSTSAKKYVSGLKDDTTIYVIDADGSDKKYEYFLERLDSYSDKLHIKWISSDDTKAKTLMDKTGVTKMLNNLPKELTENDKENYRAYFLTYLLLIEGKERCSYLNYASQMKYFTSNEELKASLNTMGMGPTLDAVEYVTLCSNISAELSKATDDNAYAYYANFLTLVLTGFNRHYVGEEYICRLIEYVNFSDLPARYVLTGHGETVFGETMLGFITNSYYAEMQSMSSSEEKYLDLNTAEGEKIPKGASSIIVFNPKSDISADEAKMFIDYLGQGGQMTFITSNENLSMPNLMSVIEAYGLYAEEGIVRDQVEAELSGPEITDKEKSEIEKVYEASDSYNVNAYLNEKNPALMGANTSYIVPVIKKGNSIKLDRLKCENVTFTELITTGDKAYLGEYLGQDADNVGCKNLAVSAEDPESGAKLLWFTGAESFTHKIVDVSKLDTVTASNCFSVFYTVNWVPFTYESKIVSNDGKQFDINLMSVTDVSYVWYTVVVALAVVGVGVAGFIICYRRRKFKK